MPELEDSFLVNPIQAAADLTAFNSIKDQVSITSGCVLRVCLQCVLLDGATHVLC